MVEKVKSLKTEIYFDLLGDRERSPERSIKVPAARPEQGVPRRVAESLRGLVLKRALIEPGAERLHLRRSRAARVCGDRTCREGISDLVWPVIATRRARNAAVADERYVCTVKHVNVRAGRSRED